MPESLTVPSTQNKPISRSRLICYSSKSNSSLNWDMLCWEKWWARAVDTEHARTTERTGTAVLGPPVQNRELFLSDTFDTENRWADELSMRAIFSEGRNACYLSILLNINKCNKIKHDRNMFITWATVFSLYYFKDWKHNEWIVKLNIYYYSLLKHYFQEQII